MEHHLSRLSHFDFSALVPDVIDTVLLPVGTVEAHGCTHLGTDITIPELICERLAKRNNFIIAPTVNYGITRTLLPYAGSLSVSPEAFALYVSDIICSLHFAGFSKVVVINGHGGHYDQLEAAARKTWHKTGGKTLVIHWWQFCEEITTKIFGERGGHAGIDETAMVLAADASLCFPQHLPKVESFLVREGTYVFPNASPILLYHKNEGAPRIEPELATQYAEAVCEYMGTFIAEVFDKWQKNL